MMRFQTIISVAELNEHLADQDCFVFDCRFALKDPEGGRIEFNQGHIPGAQFANLDQDLSSPMTADSGRHPLPEPSELVGKLQNWGVNNTSQIVCYDDLSGAFAARMWWLMKWLGHDDVAVLDGGIGKWMASGLPLEKGVQPKAVGRFSGQANHDMWVDIDFVQHHLERDSIRLLDARSTARFTAEDQETDPVAGHVPGASSVPFAGNLTQGGVFRSRHELRERFENRFGDQPMEVINMCGSGVTACHNILAMSIAGLPMTRLYVGSWSEWIKGKSRPVATSKA